MPEHYAPTMTIADIVRLYLRHCDSEKTHCTEARADRLRTFSLFVAMYGQLLVTRARPYHLTDFIEARPAWRSVSTRRAKANQIRAAFQWAADQERIERNPFKRVRYEEAERRPDLPDEVFERFCVLANKRFESVLRFLRFTGCRLNELCQAQWDDIDIDRGIWIIHRHKSRRYTKKPKVVALVSQAVDLLRRLEKTSAFVFVNNRGTAWNRRTLGQSLARIKKRFGIKTVASLHGIRHNFCRVAVCNGAPLKLIAAQCGHSSQAVTERYYVDLSDSIDAIRSAAELAIPKS